MSWLTICILEKVLMNTVLLKILAFETLGKWKAILFCLEVNRKDIGNE
jgi:hypothetical protein